METIMEEHSEDELDWPSEESEVLAVEVMGMTLAGLSEHVFPTLKSTPSLSKRISPPGDSESLPGPVYGTRWRVLAT